MRRARELGSCNMTIPNATNTLHNMQVLTHVAERLTDLHAAGYVHRDIKPGNVMWLPRKNRWTLIDFGCAARTGEKARKGFSFSYAAPEVLAAVKAGKQTFNVSEALDVWSIGILAIEMFTGQPVYSCLQTKQTVRALFSVYRVFFHDFFLDYSWFGFRVHYPAARFWSPGMI